MNKTEIARTRRFAGILKELYSKVPNYEVASLILLQMMDLSDTGLALQQKRQDWESIAASLLDSHFFAKLYQRCSTVVEAARKNPGSSYAEIATLSGYQVVSVSQTINALAAGGFQFDVVPVKRAIGRPRKLISLRKP